jgi:hypothetical protein
MKPTQKEEDKKYYDTLNFMATEPSCDYAIETIKDLRKWYLENGYFTDKQRKTIVNIMKGGE